MIKKFYENALPTQGVYCASGITKIGVITERFAETFDGLINNIEKLKARGQNVYVTPGTFGCYSRKAIDSVYVRSFFVDLDVGKAENKSYPSKVEALEALEVFIKAMDLPRPVRLDSGIGVHAYWIFDRDVPTTEWKPYAERFKQLCMSNGLIIDPTVTADAARLMRCPDTINYRPDPPAPTKLIDEDITVHSFEALISKFGEVAPSVKSILSGIPKGLDEETLKQRGLDNFETRFEILGELSVNDEGCAQVKYALLNPKTLDYGAWAGILSLVSKCEDMDEAVRWVSEGHKDYNYDAAYKKALSFDSVQSCEKFASDNPSRCEGCTYRGKITNPLKLARRLKVATVTEEVNTDTVREEAPVQESIAWPDFLHPYSRGINGGIYYTPPPKTSKDGKKTQDDPIRLVATDVFAIKRMYSPLDGDCLMMRNVLPHDAAREFLIPMKNAYAQEELSKVLSTFGVLYEPHALNHLKGYVVKWGQYLQQTKSAEQMRMQFGWTEDDNGFVVGHNEYRRDGTVVKTAVSPYVKELAKLFVTQGSYDKWKEAAQLLNTPSLEHHAFAMLCGFASPLMRLTSTSGVTISYVGESGAAKTGALFAGLSSFGNPKELCVFDATTLGLTGRCLGLHSLMFGMDEVTNREGKELSQLIHQISHGKGRIKMQSSVNAERSLEMSASLIAMFTSNRATYDKLTLIKASPDGEMARMVEFFLTKPAALAKNPALGEKIFDTFRLNYGFAGPEFIQHYYKVGDADVMERFYKWRDRFRLHYITETEYRFHENLVGIVFATGEYLNEMGIIKLDLERIYTQIVKDMIDIKNNTVKINHLDHKELLGEFVNQYHAGILVLNDGKVVSEPRMSLVGRAEVHNEMMYVSKTAFKTYLAERNVSTQEFEFAMNRDKILAYNGKQRLSSGWKAGISSPPIHVYGFKSEFPEELLRDV